MVVLFRDLYFSIGQKRLEWSLHNKVDECFIPFFKSSIMDGYFTQTLQVLDNGESSNPLPIFFSLSSNVSKIISPQILLFSITSSQQE